MGTRLGLGSALLGALLGACASSPPGSTLEVSTDCQVRAMPGGGAGASPAPGGFSIGVGGFSGGSSAPKGGCDGPCPDSGPRSGVGGGISFDLGQLLRSARKPDPALGLLSAGPSFPAEFSMSCLPVRGLVQGGWPMVVDYALGGAGKVSVEIHLEEGGAPFVQRLDGGPGRHLSRFDLPASLGARPRPALVLVRADEDRGGPPAPAQVQLYGLGAGPRAVGSVAIDQVDFSPQNLRRSARETASYTFFARSDFNRLAVGVLRVHGGEGVIKVSLAREYPFDGGVSRGTWFGRGERRSWDGSDARNQPSLGAHILQVRAWASAAEAGDWVTAWSGRGVQVSE
jgi:hypothetical protein